MKLGPQQRKLWRAARKRVGRWGQLREEDYDFRSWANDRKLLDAGCAYEYARDSHKFRCLLWLDTRGREQHSVSGILVPLKGKSSAYLAKSGWETWLRIFSDELIDNKSFAELLRTSKKKVSNALAALASYSRFPKAVEKPGRHIMFRGDGQPELFYPGSRVVSIQIFWRHYTNKEIGEEMKRLAPDLRPPEEAEPQRKGKGKLSGTTHLLDALSAMRLASWYPTSPPGSRAGLLSVRGALTALDRFNDIRLGGTTSVDESNFYSYIREARQLVKFLFLGELADNAKSWTERQGVRK